MNMLLNKKKTKIILLMLLIICAFTVFFLSRQPKHKAIYTLSVSGKITQSGVINYVGKDMNVYKNLASNPCGQCQYQPVSLYVGADSKQVIQAIETAIKNGNDIWTVKSVSEGEIILEEKNIGESKKPENPSAPEGLTVSGEYSPAR